MFQNKQVQKNPLCIEKDHHRPEAVGEWIEDHIGKRTAIMVEHYDRLFGMRQGIRPYNCEAEDNVRGPRLKVLFPHVG